VLGAFAKAFDPDHLGEGTMIDLVHAAKFGSTMAMVAVLNLGLVSPSRADDGTIRMRITKVGFIGGLGGGSGILTFKGRQYHLRIGGISAGTIGISAMDLVGTAKNLRTASDIAGPYSVGSASLAVAGGAKVATLQNSNGVVLQLQGKQVGFEASLSVSGLTISLK
jgi:hypothetical protein